LPGSDETGVHRTEKGKDQRQSARSASPSGLPLLTRLLRLTTQPCASNVAPVFSRRDTQHRRVCQKEKIQEMPAACSVSSSAVS